MTLLVLHTQWVKSLEKELKEECIFNNMALYFE